MWGRLAGAGAPAVHREASGVLTAPRPRLADADRAADPGYSAGDNL